MYSPALVQARVRAARSTAANLSRAFKNARPSATAGATETKLGGYWFTPICQSNSPVCGCNAFNAARSQQ